MSFISAGVSVGGARPFFAIAARMAGAWFHICRANSIGSASDSQCRSGLIPSAPLPSGAWHPAQRFAVNSFLPRPASPGGCM